VNSSLTAGAIVNENCLGPGSTCGKDNVQPIIDVYTSTKPNTGTVIDFYINAYQMASQPVNRIADDMVYGWKHATPLERTGMVVVTVVVGAIILPIFL